MIAFSIYTITTKDVVKAEEIDWSFGNKVCEVSFLATNTADRIAECTFLFRAFDYVHTHNRKYELLGKKELNVLLGPKERKRIKDKFEILPTFKPTRFQLTVLEVKLK